MSDMIVETKVTTVAEYSEIEAWLAEFKKENANLVHDPTTTAGMKALRAHLSSVVKSRTTLDAIRKTIKADPYELCKRIDSQAKVIELAHREVESPMRDLITAQEKIKADEKAERERINQERVRKIQDEIGGFRFQLSEYHPSDELAARLAVLEAVEVDDRFGEFKEQALHAKADAIVLCSSALDTSQEREESEAKAKAEREIEEARQAEERDRQDAERKEADERRAAEQAERDAKVKAEQEAEDKRLADERAELDAKREAQEKADAEESARLEGERRVIAQAKADLEREEADAERKRLADEEEERAEKAEVERVAADNEAWDALVAESKYPTQEEALNSIAIIADGTPDASQLRVIRAICIANTAESN